jgi:hypothetical protein
MGVWAAQLATAAPTEASAVSITDWMTGVGTCVAALGTVGTLIWIVWQFLGEREERARLRHRAAAEKISVWYVGELREGEDDVALLNRAGEPVYNVVVSLVMIQGDGPRSGKESPAEHKITLSILPPGQHWVSFSVGWRGMMRQAGAEISFSDLAGAHWVRQADGRLEEISVPPFDHYQLQPPFSLGTPRGAR